MTVILDQFIHTLIESGLMTKEDINIFLEGLPVDERPSDGEHLAKLLFQRKKLTKFQTQAIYQGKTKGLVIGNYVVLDKIGEGGMGHVYKARHRRMKRVVALKVLPSAMTKTREAVERFEREVEVIAKLEHTNIVTAHDADEADGVHFLVMQYVKGSDLAELVRKNGTLSVAKALDYLIQAGRGLDYAHAQGVIHRDIKPSNLLLDHQGTVKILDMGLARLEQEVGPLDSTAAASLTQSGQVMGTADYMPPEQSMDTHRVDLRADIYSLGCTLYYLLTGRAVFAGDTLAKKIMAHREKAVPSLRVLRADVPEELDVVFQKMLAKRPEDRHSKMSEVLADLGACRATVEDGVEETITYRSEASEIGTTNTQHEATVDKRDDDSALERWLHEELPAGPTHFISPPRKKRLLTRQRVVIGSVAASICFLFLCLGVIVSIGTPEGTLVVTVSEPNAEILIDNGKLTLRSSGDNEPVTVEVVEGKHTLSVNKGGFKTQTQEFTIESGGRETFHVELVPLMAATTDSGEAKDAPQGPPSSSSLDAPLAEPDAVVWKELLPADAPAAAIAPFDGQKAKEHQEAWAKYLDAPVEQEVALADGVTMAMVLIPPGEFLMGSSSEEQARFIEEASADDDQWLINRVSSEVQHQVRITRPFRLGRHEVTVGQFRQFVEGTGYQTEAERDGKGGFGYVDGKLIQDPRFVWNTDPGFELTDDHPVVNVSWNDAIAFCQWLSKEHNLECRLPTGAQWEYACRAGTTTAWSCGDSDRELEEHAWSNANSRDKAHRTGQLKSNGWGLHDIHGNVWEWCADRWATDYYTYSPPNDPNGPPTGSTRVLRGGDWCYPPVICRSALRIHRPPDNRGPKIGFRMACVVADKRVDLTSPATEDGRSKGDMPEAKPADSQVTRPPAPDSERPVPQPEVFSGPPRYLAIWVRNVPPVDWKAAYDLNEADFQKTSARYGRLGYAPSGISGYLGKDDQYMFAAVWLKKPRAVKVETDHSLDPDQFRRQREDLAGRGFRPVWFDVYGKGPEWRYATVWVQDNSNIVWRVENYDVNPGDADGDRARQASWDSLIATGYLPHVSSAHVDGNGGFHQIQIWHKESCLWGVWFGDFNLYQAKLDEYKSGDLGPVYVESNANGPNVHYAQIERASAGVEWTTTASLDSVEFQQDFDRLSKAGYRPTVISVR